MCLLVQVKAQPVITLSKGIAHVKECFEGIKDALAANDGAAAQNKAKDLVKALNEVPVKYMTPAQVSQWTKYSTQLLSESTQISQTSTVASQQVPFTSLSTDLQAAIDALKLK